MTPPPKLLTDPEREAWQNSRCQKALEQWPSYTFQRVVREGREWFDCHAIGNGETYEVTRWNCTCDDYQFRGRPYGLICKHVLMLELALQTGRIVPPSPLIPKEPA